jgi:hypothetical protein
VQRERHCAPAALWTASLQQKIMCVFTFEIFTAMKVQVEVFWVMTPCSVAVGCQRFGGTCCLHVHGEDLKYVYVYTS